MSRLQHLLLPPLIFVWTISHSASLGSSGQSASPGSDFATPPLWACEPSATLQLSNSLTSPHSGSTLFLGHSSSPSGIWIPTYISGSAAATWILCIAHPLASLSVLPTINMKHNPGSVLGFFPPSPAQGSPLALTTAITSLDCLFMPPPGSPSSSKAFSCIPMPVCAIPLPATFTIPPPHPLLFVFMAWGCTFWEGTFCHTITPPGHHHTAPY
ncbi:B-cell receptor CD22-like protein [Labeo rohita]|uniref:B-cell receptor CD22-like protein n=1 Tax=Labeo rohita TaxID=84645 RepID=A0A498L7G8_LABRO|nr:B-cell receptor CD22-like protein [Labeo rohita]